ncbi:MAG: amidohydrolase family protein, partial [Acidimicrobiia bacterium]
DGTQAFDLVVRGGRVVDGSGVPPYAADVAVRGGRIVRVGRVSEAELAAAERVIDATDLHVLPGFVDIHTHYDAQLHFEPTASPASWHGVTTVIMGNCGFTIAPARPDDAAWLLEMLSRVEGMSPEALQAGVTFTGGSFGDFLDGLEGRIGVNAAAYVGHSAVRRYVMGDESQTRAATPEEIVAMQELVRAAMRDGAAGFSTSQIAMHQAHNGLPVPSNLATDDEVVALCEVLAEFDHGAIEIIPRSFPEGYDAADRALLREMSVRSGKPIDLNPVVWFPNIPDGWTRSMEFIEEQAAAGLRMYPMYAAHRGGAYYALDTTFLFDDMPAFRDALLLPEPARSAALRDPAVRDRMRAELVGPPAPSFPVQYELTTVYAVHKPEHEQWVGRTLADVAAERGGDPLDAFLDLALDDDLKTTFFVTPLLERGGRVVTEALVTNPLAMAGSSDGGAHLASFVGADYTTRLLTEWVPNPLSLEEAVRRLTAIPAAIHGLRDRGTVRVGSWADLVLVDLDALAVGQTRWVEDLPAGAGRLVVDAAGYRAVVVNGEVILEDGKATGARPGHVIRG